MVKFYSPEEVRARLNKDRHETLCNDCRHYRACVSKNYYCPPYGVAFLWIDASDRRDERRLDALLGEIKVFHDEGWSYENFCEGCKHRRCGYFAYTNAKRLLWHRKVCGALRFVHDEIPCPVRGLLSKNETFQEEEHMEIPGRNV